jgi:hypothetical protein
VDDRTDVQSPDTTAYGTVELAVPPERRFIRISPLNTRRWQNFKANRRGYWSLWVFLILFVISLFAEFIANDRPIFIDVNGHFYFPAIVTYPDTTFGKPDDPNLFGTAAHPLLLQHAGEQAAVAVPLEADLDADQGRLPIRRHAQLHKMRPP